MGYGVCFFLALGSGVWCSDCLFRVQGCRDINSLRDNTSSETPTRKAIFQRTPQTKYKREKRWYFEVSSSGCALRVQSERDSDNLGMGFRVSGYVFKVQVIAGFGFGVEVFEF